MLECEEDIRYSRTHVCHLYLLYDLLLDLLLLSDYSWLYSGQSATGQVGAEPFIMLADGCIGMQVGID